MGAEKIKYNDEWVLVVDDEESVREPLVEMLKHLGFRADSAANGKEGLEKLGKEPSYTFLLTDMNMPEMDGLELIGHVKSDYPHICSIAMTGYTKEYKYMDVVNAGATDFINKPFSLEELEAKVKRAVKERDIRQELSRLSITDSLTGLFNQRHFYGRLKDEIKRSERQKQKQQLGLILMDLDNFKNFNDKYGHLAGDDLLQKVGVIINACIREGVDSGYRYGGDEFAVILIDADTDIGRAIGKRIEKAIEKECGIGASIGYANFEEGMRPEDFVGKADEFLFKFKGEKKSLGLRS
ncbi:MAG: diguanylate cyclase [Deltaproteobacteria bacterium]|nr:diguanylate cyclase [Deltaproteobacteria bacterium]MBW2117908.1 diguanylate cyclase [Deltaproteobacteria bacterium]MBW2345552.1 diguanylate cyclase [Deltaproteobacteria bacterium]